MDPLCFADRHIGLSAADEAAMLGTIGAASRAELIKAIVPASIVQQQAPDLPAAVGEEAALEELRAIAARNMPLTSCIGQGYHGTSTPGVILRNILENPAWYTAYTPYQAEISQGRLEALVNFQTMITDLTGLDVANASLLDEATAAAEAMTMALRVHKGGGASRSIFVADDVLPQTMAVLRTRSRALDIDVVVGPAADAAMAAGYAVLLQYPGVNGEVRDLAAIAQAVHARGGLVIVAADVLALTLLVPPGEQGADICVGSTQRFGMPMGCGGPHAAYMATREQWMRSLPGRLVGVSIDAAGRTAYRLALQTREQHIRRDKATSNICTAQVLPAVVAGMYAVYHGREGLTAIARRVAHYTAILAAGLQALSLKRINSNAFDTLELHVGDRTVTAMQAAVERGINLRRASEVSIGISLDETTTREVIERIWDAFEATVGGASVSWEAASRDAQTLLPETLRRGSDFLTHPVFSRYRTETEMLRYLRRLADKDLALDRTMIPLGSCTMKLNATSEMLPMTWPAFANIHPFAPAAQREGYAELSRQLCRWLAAITSYAGVSLEPNAGSQGEYAGLLAIRAWHDSRGERARRVCLIPESAHGTNPASAQMAGMQVVVVKCDARGDIDMGDLAAKCRQYAATLAAIMITYPSTYGIYDLRVKEICSLVRSFGGRVYVDGANLNALAGIASPGAFGGDVSHLNLHKTFCIPHGGGGPGVGPICVVEDLVPFLPRGAVVGAVSAAPLGNAAVLPISWMYIRMMGAQGLRRATEAAILSANYIAARLAPHFDIRFSAGVKGIAGGGVAHECIIDLRDLKDTSGISAEDVAKRLIDYGFHAPTLSFPVAGTLMVEPTESESLAEQDRFCDAMIAIRGEIAKVEKGEWDRNDNPLRNAPHTAEALVADDWKHAYGREAAAYPLKAVRENKYWSPVARVDNVWGDRNFSCACPPVSDYRE